MIFKVLTVLICCIFFCEPKCPGVDFNPPEMVTGDE